MAVSVDVARQLWRGQTRMTSVLYRSRLDDGAEVLLHRRQDSECSLAYFYIAATLMLKKNEATLTGSYVWDDKPTYCTLRPVGGC